MKNYYVSQTIAEIMGDLLKILLYCAVQDSIHKENVEHLDF